MVTRWCEFVQILCTWSYTYGVEKKSNLQELRGSSSETGPGAPIFSYGILK
jgi:hypothetical protein